MFILVIWDTRTFDQVEKQLDRFPVYLCFALSVSSYTVPLVVVSITLLYFPLQRWLDT